LLARSRLDRPLSPVVSTTEPRIKRGGMTFSLLREDGGRVEDEVDEYRDGDTFKAIISCPPSMSGTWELGVYQNGQAAFPLEPAKLSCGNTTTMPGAFRVAGRERETVCVIWGEDRAIDRSVLRTASPSALPNARCILLKPAE